MINVASYGYYWLADFFYHGNLTRSGFKKVYKLTETVFFMSIRDTVSQKVRDYIASAREGIDKAKKAGLVLLVTNLSSFSTVAMERYISGYSKEQAAFINSLSAVPCLYDIGFNLGHQIFYDDDNFLKTKEKYTGLKNLDIIPRPIPQGN